MIEVKKLAKRFEGGEALKGIDFKVNVGEICALAGAKGSGKTTAADLLAGSIEQDAGQILVCGVDIMEHPSQARQHLGYVPAKAALYLDMTPRAGMKFIADARGISGREAAEMIDAAVRRFGLKDIVDTKMNKLSAGARKMVALAQAAFTNPEVIVIDEPTAGLDPKEILEMRAAIGKLRKAHAVVLTSESLTELCAVADRVLILKDGAVAAEGTPDELHRLTMNDGTLHLTVRGEESAVKNALSAVRDAELTKVEAAEEGAYEAVLTAKSGADIREAAFRAVCGKGLVLLGMKNGTKPLDELLMGLTSERIVLAPEKEEQADEGGI